jgi:MFS family permease
LYGVISYALFLRLHASPTVENLFLAQLLPSLCMGAVWGGYPTTVTEILPVGVRSTGVSILYNFAVMLFGGLAPFTITWLIQYTHDPLAPAYYIVFGVIVSLLTYGIWGQDARRLAHGTA